MNFSASEHYIEAHTLHLDNQWGACGQCEHLKKKDASIIMANAHKETNSYVIHRKWIFRFHEA